MDLLKEMIKQGLVDQDFQAREMSQAEKKSYFLVLMTTTKQEAYNTRQVKSVYQQVKIRGTEFSNFKCNADTLHVLHSPTEMTNAVALKYFKKVLLNHCDLKRATQKEIDLNPKYKSIGLPALELFEKYIKTTK